MAERFANVVDLFDRVISSPRTPMAMRDILRRAAMWIRGAKNIDGGVRTVLVAADFAIAVIVTRNNEAKLQIDERQRKYDELQRRLVDSNRSLERTTADSLLRQVPYEFELDNDDCLEVVMWSPNTSHSTVPVLSLSVPSVRRVFPKE